MSTSIRHRLQLVLVTGVLLTAVTAEAEDSLQSVLTPEEYRQAGLAKLDAGEQAALLRAMERRGLANPAAPVPAMAATVDGVAKPAEKKSLLAAAKEIGAEQLPAKKSQEESGTTDVEAQMTHPFQGLQGGTIFRLDNGQVWQQRIPETYYLGKSIPNPKVTIRRTRLGYKLLIPAVESDFAVAVKRIQ